MNDYSSNFCNQPNFNNFGLSPGEIMNQQCDPSQRWSNEYRAGIDTNPSNFGGQSRLNQCDLSSGEIIRQQCDSNLRCNYQHEPVRGPIKTWGYLEHVDQFSRTRQNPSPRITGRDVDVNLNDLVNLGGALLFGIGAHTDHETHKVDQSTLYFLKNYGPGHR